MLVEADERSDKPGSTDTGTGESMATAGRGRDQVVVNLKDSDLVRGGCAWQ